MNYLMYPQVSMLERLRGLDQDQCHIIKWCHFFQDKDTFCFVFELLDISFLNFMEKRELAPLRLEDVRHITQQVLMV